jgi:hypothetical protein
MRMLFQKDDFNKLTEVIRDRDAGRFLRGIRTRAGYAIRPILLLRNDWANKKKSEWVYIDQPLILISQIQRSGGTLMSQLFDDHPGCYAYPSEIEWGNPMKYYWPNLDLKNMSASQIFNYIYYGADDGSFDKFIVSGFSKQSWLASSKEKFPFIFNKRLQRKIFKRLLSTNSSERQRDILNCYATSFFNAWIDYQNLYKPNKKFITGFTPRVNMYADSRQRFFRDYPDGYMISIIRHPASWFVSARKHNPREYGDLHKAIEQWCISTEAGLALKKTYGDRLILVLFENLVKNTKDTMKKICETVSLEWDESLTVPTFNSMPIKADSSFKVKAHGVVKDSVQRHIGMLSEDEMGDINRKAMPLYEQGMRSCINQTSP